MIIDFHAHTTNGKLWGLHTDSATIDDLKEQAAAHGIDEIILMATYFPFKKGGVYNHILSKRIEGEPIFKMFGSLDTTADIEKSVEELRVFATQKKIAGIKLYPGYQPIEATSSKLNPVYKLALEFRLPVVFHSGELHHCCNTNTPQKKRPCKQAICPLDQLQNLAHPSSLAIVAAMWPDINFVFSHLGNPFFDEMREAMKHLPNIWTDISGQFKSGSDEDTPGYRETVIEEIKKFLDLPNGINRVMFGTDFPIQSYSDSIELVESLGLTNCEKEQIYFKNANRLLKGK